MPVKCPKNTGVYCVEYPIKKLMELIDELSVLLEEYMGVNGEVAKIRLLDTIYKLYSS